MTDQQIASADADFLIERLSMRPPTIEYIKIINELNQRGVQVPLSSIRNVSNRGIADDGMFYSGPPTNNPKTKEESCREKLRTRHLSKGERESYHKPASDWKSTKVGDVCKSSSSLVVEDILVSHGIAIPPKVRVVVRKERPRKKEFPKSGLRGRAIFGTR